MDRVPLSEADGHMAELASVSPDEKVRRPIHLGLAKGQIWIADDFDDPLPDDLLKAFYGLEPDEPWPDHLKNLPG